MNLINELHLKMIDFNSGDPQRIQHFSKVHSYAKLIGECENLDPQTQYILELSALTHDIGIRPGEEKFGRCDGKIQEEIGPDYAKGMMLELGFEDFQIDRVCYLIAHHHSYTNIVGIDYQILVEADFLVNFFEANMGKETVEKTIKNIFKTKTGIKLCKTMFL